MAMVLLVAVGTAGGGFDVFAVLLLIALLVTRELVAAHATRDLRAHVGVFVFAGLVVFVLVVVERVRRILNP